MNRNAQSLIIWIAFLGLALLFGLRSNVFENSALNIAYEAGALIGGTLLIIIAYAAFNSLVPRKPAFLPWLLLGAIIAAFVFAKLQADKYFRSESEKIASIMTRPDPNDSLSFRSFQPPLKDHPQADQIDL